MRAPRAIVALVIALCASRADAQPSTENRTRALELFDQSAVHYKSGEFERLRDALAAHAD